MNLAELSKDELLAGLHSLVSQRRVLEARLLAHLVEVERRALHLQEACSTIYEFCVERLRMSEDESARRVAAARIAARYPVVLERIDAGKLHLTNLLLLREHLTSQNHLELLHAAAGRTKSQLMIWLAARTPRPDVPSSVTPIESPVIQTPAQGNAASPASVVVPAAPKARVEPLSAQRFRVEFSASTEFCERLQRVKELMSHSNPSGDLEKLFGAALERFEEVLEKRVFTKTSRPRRRTGRPTKRGYVRSATRRTVFERDGRQCTYVDEHGRRCSSRWQLEPDHLDPRARGGSDEASNLAVKCRAHNHLAAVEAFGRDHVEKKIAERRAARAAKAPGATVALGSRQRGAVGTLDERSSGVDPHQLGTPTSKDEGEGASGTAGPVERNRHPSALARPTGLLRVENRPSHPSVVADVHPSGSCGADDLALRALTRLGFKAADVRRALSILAARGCSGAIEMVVREALRVLT